MASLSFQNIYNIAGVKSAYAGEDAFGFWFINLVDGDRTKSVILLADRADISLWVEPTDNVLPVPSILTQKGLKKNA